ncbi:YggS family pyridoxal phosphate-dependent enzyme [Bacillaceae bacterium S4-13-56]
MPVAKNLAQIKQRIEDACKKSNRNPEDIQIIAVTKYVSNERAAEALEAGIKHFGENRVEGIQAKFTYFQDKAHYHFIGTLQSRKVKELLPYIEMLHSLDRESIAKEIDKRSERVIPCFVQVNTSGEESKQGLDPSEVEAFIEKLANYSKVRVVGLMTMAPLTENQSKLRETFTNLRELKEKIEAKGLTHAPCHFLSMGMSNDFEIAIEEGATHVRIGSALVGHE